MQSEQMVSKEFIIKFLTGESTKDENLLINQWLNKKAENKRYFDEIEFLWKASGISRDLNDDDKKNDWNIILGKIGEEPENQLLKSQVQHSGIRKIFGDRTRKGLNNFLKIAAIFFLAFSFSWASFYLLNKKPDTASFAYNQIITTKGEKSQIILSDGTKIWLNSESVLKYPSSFNEIKREVFLEGEAFFEVQKKDDKIPFVVNTSHIDIEVLGTSFNVMAYSDEESFETTVVTGSVCIQRKSIKPSPDQNFVLKPNQKVTILKRGSQITLSEIETDKPTLVKKTRANQSISSNKKEQIIISPNVDIELHTAWREDKLIFQSETCENIAYKLERWYDVKIHIQNEELKKYRYTGKFEHKETLSQVLEILNLTTPINYTFKQNDLYIDIATN
ncbi:MAG: FecR family protein [Bacteroidales bacterium]|nr:FecR family protein [Bacteroidales bacterium]